MKTRIIVLAVVATLALTSCSTPASTPTETPSPTPTEMTTAEAGEYYLATVCPANAAGKSYDQVTAAYDAADMKDFSPLPIAAAANRDASRTAAERLDDESVIWPPKLVDDVAAIRDSYFAYVSYFGTQADTTAIEEFTSVAWVPADESAGASQRIRSRLDLPADTSADCEKYL